MWFVKKGEVYLDALGGPSVPPPRWCYSPEDATRYRDAASARTVAQTYGARVVVRKRVSFKARAEKAEAEVERLRIIVSAAEDLASYPCHCNECWTERDRHDPKGCTWEDATDLRAALAEHGDRSTSAKNGDGT